MVRVYLYAGRCGSLGLKHERGELRAAKFTRIQVPAVFGKCLSPSDGKQFPFGVHEEIRKLMHKT